MAVQFVEVQKKFAKENVGFLRCPNSTPGRESRSQGEGADGNAKLAKDTHAEQSGQRTRANLTQGIATRSIGSAICTGSSTGESHGRLV